jgi:hypothetical protein
MPSCKIVIPKELDIKIVIPKDLQVYQNSAR